MIGSRYFAGKYFSSRFMGGIPQKEIVTLPVVHGVPVRGGNLMDLFKGAALMQAKRKRKDEELLGIICMFTVLEEENNELF